MHSNVTMSDINQNTRQSAVFLVWCRAKIAKFERFVNAHVHRSGACVRRVEKKKKTKNITNYSLVSRTQRRGRRVYFERGRGTETGRAAAQGYCERPTKVGTLPPPSAPLSSAPISSDRPFSSCVGCDFWRFGCGWWLKFYRIYHG